MYNDMVNNNATVVRIRLTPQYNSHQYSQPQHWHGLSQRTAPFSDGTPSASQWPIPPLHFFDYEVRPLPDDAGTYFYHAHVGFQAVTASGPLIVEDIGAPPYAYDEEIIVPFSDYFNKTDAVIEEGLVANPFVWSGETNAVLVGGVGVAIGEVAGQGSCELPVLEVEAGKTYRMRFIGATALSMVQFAIDGHENFTIIAADGQYTLPYNEKYMQVAPGQRFDVIFQAKTTEELDGKTDFLIQFETRDRPTTYTGFGVLRYAGGTPSITTAPPDPPLYLPNATYTYLEYALRPLKQNNFPTATEVTRRLTINSRQVLTHTDIWRENGDQWNESTIFDTPSQKPYLVNIYERGPDAIPNFEAAVNNGGWDPTTYAWPAKMGEVIEIIWENTGSLVEDNGGVDYSSFSCAWRALL